MSILVLQSSWWGRESWLLCLICLPGVSWWLSGSSSRCHGVVCSLWLWYFLIILTYYFWLQIYSCFDMKGTLWCLFLMISISDDKQADIIDAFNTTTRYLVDIFACGALAASISVGIVIPSTWFVYLYKQTVSITVVVMGTKQFSDKTTHRQQYELHLALWRISSDFHSVFCDFHTVF